MCIMSKKSNIIARIKELFQEEKFGADYTAATGEIIRIMGDLTVGTKVAEIAAEKEAPLPDGSYLLDNGKSIKVEAGEIKEITEIQADKEPNPIAMEDMKDQMAGEYKNEISSKLKDGTEVKIMSKGDAVSVGDEVLVKDASGEFVKAPAGDHELEGGLTINVDEEGYINELSTAPEEAADTENEEMKTMFEAVSTIKSMVDELKETLNSLKTENSELKERFNKFAAEPSVETITKKKENVTKLKSKEDKLRFFATK